MNRWLLSAVVLLVSAECALAQPDLVGPYPTTAAPEPVPTPTPAEEQQSAKSADDAAAANETTPLTANEPLPAPAEVYTWYQPAYWFGPAPWDSGIELGLNGASGTSDTLSLRTGGYIRRKTDFHKVDLSLYYNHNKADGELTQSNALLDARHDWTRPDSRWSPFVMSQTFYDEFADFDLNFNINFGLGYQLIKRETVDLTVRGGTGFSREFGGTPDEWVPEAQFGASYNHQLSKSQKFYVKSDYFPAWEDFGQYRILSEAGLEIELNQPSNMSLKLGITDRYDSESGTAPPHNTNYSAMVIWKL
jgi:putative salt-induced outer membrane protein YdiY